MMLMGIVDFVIVDKEERKIRFLFITYVVI